MDAVASPHRAPVPDVEGHDWGATVVWSLALPSQRLLWGVGDHPEHDERDEDSAISPLPVRLDDGCALLEDGFTRWRVFA